MKRIARGIQRFVLDNPTPFIVKCNHTSNRTKYDCFRGQSLEEPLKTITQTHGYAVVTPHLTKFRTGATGQELTEPAPTVTAGTSQRPGGNGHALGIVEAQLSPFVSRQFGNSIGHSVDEPAGTVTAGGGGKSALISAFLAKHFGGNYTGPGAGMDAPAHTVTTTDHHALVTSNLVKMRGTNTGQKADDPLQTVTAGGNHFGEVRAFLMKYYGNEKGGVGLNDPLGTVTTNDRFGLVTVEGIDYQIVDIGMRMLQPHELYAAQGFPSWYVIDRDYRGVKYAKDKQVARCGNAVPPPFSEALVRANLPEMCSPLSQEKIA
jgi:DNA (cytosine-5)-methyltransferase 1